MNEWTKYKIWILIFIVTFYIIGIGYLFYYWKQILDKSDTIVDNNKINQYGNKYHICDNNHNSTFIGFNKFDCSITNCCYYDSNGNLHYRNDKESIKCILISIKNNDSVEIIPFDKCYTNIYWDILLIPNIHWWWIYAIIFIGIISTTAIIIMLCIIINKNHSRSHNSEELIEPDKIIQKEAMTDQSNSNYDQIRNTIPEQNYDQIRNTIPEQNYNPVRDIIPEQNYNPVRDIIPAQNYNPVCNLIPEQNNDSVHNIIPEQNNGSVRNTNPNSVPDQNQNNSTIHKLTQRVKTIHKINPTHKNSFKNKHNKPVLKFLTKHNDKNTQCSICLSDVEINEKIYAMVCGHIFHRKCVKTWINIHNTCPICRIKIIPIKNFKLYFVN
jgi:hypothetical protein